MWRYAACCLLIAICAAAAYSATTHNDQPAPATQETR